MLRLVDLHVSDSGVADLAEIACACHMHGGINVSPVFSFCADWISGVAGRTGRLLTRSLRG